MPTKLLPCPFCGYDNVMIHWDGNCWTAKCIGCGSWGKRFHECDQGSEQKAIDAWNTRTAPKSEGDDDK